MEYVKLNNGVEMPVMGIGTFMLSPIDAENSVREALKAGYKLIDTANAYANERAVGRGIKTSGVNRKEIFVSTKLWPTEYENESAIDETLERLGLDYIDLLFLHQPAGNYLKGYKMIEKAYKEGKVKAIGISNFEGKYIEEILKNAKVLPQVMQTECHPYFPQTELRKTLDKYNIRLMSWYPLGHGDKNLLNENVFKEIGSIYGKSSVQIILRWHTQMGFIVIPGAKSKEHIKDNINIFDFKLSDEEMTKIAKVDKNERYYHQSDDALEKYANIKVNYEEE